MTTVISIADAGCRPLGGDTFAGIAPGVTFTATWGGPRSVTLVFDADLTPEQRAQVVARCQDDGQEAERAALGALLAALRDPDVPMDLDDLRAAVADGIEFCLRGA